MKVILIGATGQVGYALAPALIEAGHEVTVLVRDASRLPFSKSIRRVAVPEFDAEVFGRALRDVECAVYCVGLPEQFAFDTGVFDRVNRGLLTTFLSALEASAVRRLVYISTFEVFSPRDGVIRESHPMTPLAGRSPYFTAMTLAYQDVMEFAWRTQTRLTTIHPAAVYGGLNTGDGFTGVIENLLNWRVWRLPAVPPGRFPLVHAGSLAEGVASALLYQGPFILSDEMCDLPTLARALRRQVRSYVPLTVPASLAYGAARPIEALGRAIHRRPLLSRVQLDFIASSSEPLADRARETFGFTPLPIEKGLSRYLSQRTRLLAPSVDSAPAPPS
jgi:nucleoside-diphosphate-sugar epimerase